MDVLNKSFCFFFFFFPPLSSEREEMDECKSKNTHIDFRPPLIKKKKKNSNLMQLIYRCQTWVNHRLWRRSWTIVQLQKCLLKGLAEGVLEAGHWDTVRPVTLSITVGCWGS